MVIVMLVGMFAPALTPRAHATTDETSTFMFKNTTTFNGPNIDMVQGYTPSGASTSCPGAPGNNWTCTWSSDTFTAGQSMAAGTTTVNLYPENDFQIGFRQAASAGVQPTISFTAAGAVGTAASGNVTPGLPAGWAANDIHICVIESKDNVASTMPAGWTQLNAANSGTTHRATLYWRRAVAGDANPTVTHAAGDSIVARIIGFRGVNTSTAFDVANSFTVSAADLTTEAGGITTVTENAMLVFTAHMADNHTSIGLPTPSPGTWTQAMFSATPNGTDSSIAAHYSNLIAPPTGMGAVAATRAGAANAISHGAQLALRPAPVPLTITKPTTVLDDVMIASIAFRPWTAAVTAPAGWALVKRTDNSNQWAHSLAVYSKVVTASEPANYTWSFGTTAVMAAGGIQSFYNVDTTTPMAGVDLGQNTSTPGSGTVHPTPSMTTTVPYAMLVTSHSIGNPGPDHWVGVPAGSMTEAFDTYGGNIAIAAYYVIQAAAGATGAKRADSDFADVGNAHILALRPKTISGTLTVQLLHNAAVIGSGTVNVSSPGTPALVTASFATTGVTFADGDRLHVRVIAANAPTTVNARVWFDAATNQSRVVTPAISCTVADPTYAAATVAGTQATVYWSSPNAVTILEKAGAAITEVPVNHTTYSVGATIGGATVRYNGAAVQSSFTKTGLTPGTAYSYKVFPKSAGGCYAPGTQVDGTAPFGGRPSWSYMLAGGSMLKPGIAGTGSIYIASNASRIASLDTATGLQTWSPVTTTQPVQGWLSWVPNNGYSYRRNVTITAGAPGAPNGYSVPITLNHASLVAAGSSRADGNDVRVVYWNGASGVELDRVLDSGSAWNTASTKIWIKTQAAIAASGSDSNYYVYYGNPLAANPPANSMNVFLFHDDFSGASIDTSKWTVTRGSTSVFGGVLTLNALTSIWAPSGYAFGTSTSWEARVQLTGDGTSASFNYHTPSDQDGYTGAWVAFSTDDVSTRAATASPPTVTINTWVPTTPTAYHTYTINREGATNVRFFQDTTQVDNISTSIPTGNLRPFIWNDTALTMKLDWYTVRQYVTPEPTTALAPQQAETWGSVIGGDQSGRVYSLDAVVGTANWTTNLSAQANAVQAGIAAQIWSYSDAAFQAAYTTDVLFAASRNTGATNCGTAATNNKLFALRADTGASLWTFNATCTYSIDYIVGMPYVDYNRNRVYLATRGTGSTLWILNTLDGAVVQQLALGDLDTSPALSADGTTIYVGNTAGLLYAVDATTFTATSHNLASAVKSVIFEDWTTPGLLYFSTMDGNLWGLQHNGGASFTQVFKVAVAGASTPLLLDKLYVGSSDGRLHEFDLSGGNEKVYPASGMLDGSTVGDVSTEDGTHVFVGTNGGKLFKIQVPLP